MRYENPLYMVEDAGAADLPPAVASSSASAAARPSRSSKASATRDHPREGTTDADMAREHTDVFLQALSGVGFAEPSPTPMFPASRALRPEPHSPGTPRARGGAPEPA